MLGEFRNPGSGTVAVAEVVYETSLSDAVHCFLFVHTPNKCIFEVVPSTKVCSYTGIVTRQLIWGPNYELPNSRQDLSSKEKVWRLCLDSTQKSQLVLSEK